MHLVAHYQSKFFDLRREMTLIDLSSSRTDTVAHRLTELSVRMEALREDQRTLVPAGAALRSALALDRATVILPVASVDAARRFASSRSC